MLLDERVRRGGSHHQKLFVIRHRGRPDGDVAFVGGIDLCHGRHDDAGHLGDPQAVELDDGVRRRDRRGTTCSSRSAARRSPTLADTFRERWEDPHAARPPQPGAGVRRPGRAASRAIPTRCRRGAPTRAPAGTHAVQVLRTYPAQAAAPTRSRPSGERSIARAYLKAFARARRLVYIEDQYFWSPTSPHALADALRAHPELQRDRRRAPLSPTTTGASSGRRSRIGRERALRRAARAPAATGSRVYDLENDAGTPIYVHAKVCVVDDVWMTVGSDNINRRSWTHDSELSCAVLDADARRARAPRSGRPRRRRAAPRPRHPAAALARAPRAHRRDRRRRPASIPTRGFAAFRAHGARRSTPGTHGGRRRASGRPVTCASIDPSTSRPATLVGARRVAAS